MLSVEAAMRFYAEKFGEDVEYWGLVGLLHDFDWEIHPSLDQHPQDGAPILRERGVSEEIIQDILSHADHLNLPRDTLVRKAISACDEITGLITAVALVRPSRSLYDLQASSVKKQWKDKAFAAGTVEGGHGRLPALSEAEDPDDLGREVLRFLVPEGIGQGCPLDVLDHVRDVAAERRRVEIRPADDVPAQPRS